MDIVWRQWNHASDLSSFNNSMMMIDVWNAALLSDLHVKYHGLTDVLSW